MKRKHNRRPKNLPPDTPEPDVKDAGSTVHEDTSSDIESLQPSALLPHEPRVDYIFKTKHDEGPWREPHVLASEVHKLPLPKLTEPPPFSRTQGLQFIREHYSTFVGWILKVGLPNGTANRERIGQWLLMQSLDVTPENLGVACDALKGSLVYEQPEALDPLYIHDELDLNEPSEREPEPEPEQFVWLRQIIGISPRELQSMLDNRPDFNQPRLVRNNDLLTTDEKFKNAYERVKEGKQVQINGVRVSTVPGLLNLLPLVERRPFFPRQLNFYRDYASGLYTEDELVKRYGVHDVSTVLHLENDLIRALRLKIPEMTERDLQSDLESAWEMERAAIAANGLHGGTIITDRFRFGSSKDMNYQMSSFERGWVTRFDGRGGGQAEHGGSNYGDSEDDEG